jgi:pimeloyl-ACP methyl ester carboxylesterase
MARQTQHVRANGQDHPVIVWEPAHSPARATVVLLHGYMDAPGTFADVVPALLHAGLRVLAPHQRGFGEGPRVPRGAYYHFPDYVFDLAEIVDALVPSEPFFLVGHSMGGTVATMYAGAFPERVTRLALLEGTGPIDNPPGVAPIRMRKWIEDVRALATKEKKPVKSPEDALRRLAQNHGQVPVEVLRQRLDDLLGAQPDGTYEWLFDPLHRTLSPSPFFVATYKEFAKRVACPVLVVDGGPSGYQPPDEAERVASFADVRKESLPNAGHMLHWTEPSALARLLVEFFAPA